MKYNDIDAYAVAGLAGEPYDWDNYNDLTYSAWITGRRLAGKAPLKEGSKTHQDGAAAKVSLHPANWR